MTPLIASAGGRSIRWPVDWTLPVKPLAPVAAGAGLNSAGTSYPFGNAGASTWAFGWDVGSHSGGGNAGGETAGGAWAFVADGDAGVGNAGVGFRVPMWRPALDPLTCPPGADDENQRIFWARIHTLELAAHARPAIADSLGFQLVPDDGLSFATATWPVAASGGFGIFRRVGSDGHRFASYGPAAALLEAVNFAAAEGWHVADIIIRQAVFGDATTPWLTVRWDGVDVIRERPFGNALLPTPQSIRAAAHGWALYFGLFPTDTGRMAVRARIRIGRFHPDGFVQP